MFDDAAAPVATVQPDPPRAVPARIGKVLGLVRTLIAHGQNVADTLRRHAADPHVLPCFALLAAIFSTGDPPLILARISRGLLRAAALEARLSKRAARGRDLKPTPIRVPASRKPRTAKPITPPSRPAEVPSPAPLPTTEEILAKDRHRSIGAVLVGICRDLGIAPGLVGRATWDEVRHEIVEYGGSLATLLLGPEDKRRSGDPARNPRPSHFSPSSCGLGPRSGPKPGGAGGEPIAPQPTIAVPAPPAPSPQSPAPACTGPP